MEENRQERKNHIQNLVIALLAVSAVLLLARTQIAFRGGTAGSGYLSRLFSGETASETARQKAPADLTDLAEPVRVAVTGTYGRYGALNLTTADSGFSEMGTLLREALGSAGTPQSCKESDFRGALSATSVYYDFGENLPLSVLAGLMGTSAEDGGTSARRLALSASGDGVALWLGSGDGKYQRCATAVTKTALAELVNSYQLGNASFAFELESGRDLAPYSLLLTGGQADYQDLTAASSLGNSDDLLSSLQFSPRTHSRYPESGGTEVVVGSDRTVRIRSDGNIFYQDNAAEPVLQITAQGEQPTSAEAVLGCCRLLSGLLNGQSSSASLALRSIRRTGNIQVLEFDYQFDGVLIRQSSGKPAAQVTLSGKSVVSLSLLFRQYTAAGTSSLLLPLAQTLAIADSHHGAELSVGYVDDGTGAVHAGWLAG
jgi:hypothetical protein